MAKTMKLLALLLALLLPAASLAEVIELPIDDTPGLPFQGKFEYDNHVYEDPSIRVERFKIENQDTDYNASIFYCTVKIAHPSQLRTAAVNGFDHKNQAQVVVMAKRNNAVLAINGDFYGARSESYVLRQGKVYRDSVGPDQDILLIDEDGDFHVILAADDPANVDKTTVNGKKVINALCFGPALIVDNEPVMVKTSTPQHSTPNERAQRMCLIQTGPLEYMTLCVRRQGCTLDEMVTLVQELCPNVEVAYILDGGESSQMVFMNNLINKDRRTAREVTDIVYFASAYKPEE